MYRSVQGTKEVVWVQDFENIYIGYVKDVYRFLLKLSGSHDIAEELTQTTFAIAFENLDKFRGTCKISVWLCQIAKHEYYAYYKRCRRFVAEEDLEEYETDDHMEDEVLDRVQQIQIHRILHGLPDPYKEVFTMRVMAELSYKDSSELFGKTESWARVTYYRAKCMIIERLGGESDVKM